MDIDFVQIQAKQSVILEQLSGIVNDHERRIRWLERTLMYGIGAMGAAKVLWDSFVK